MSDTLEQLALEEARRAVDQQVDAVDEVRSRASAVTVSAALVISFLGGQALEQSGWTVFSGLALCAFLATLALCAAIAWPRDSWQFRVDPTILLEDFGDGQERHITPGRHLAESLAHAAADNEPRLQRLYLYYRLCLGGLALQAACWSLQLASHSS
jgi:hypothetical protein